MLHAVSWVVFIKAILLFILLYYVFILFFFFRKEVWGLLRHRGKTLFGLAAGMVVPGVSRAQDGKQGMSQANDLIRGYYDSATQLMYAVGAIVALVGAIRVYRHLNAGHQQDAYQAAAAWFGACLFLVIVATVIKSFFGI